MTTKEKISQLTKRIVNLLKESDGMRMKGIVLNFEANRKGLAYNYDTATKPTVIKAVYDGVSKGLIQHDVVSHKYRVTTKGKDYIEKFGIADLILSSDYIDSYFDWNSLRKEPTAAVYNLSQQKEKGSSHSLALLISRAHRTQPLEWLRDIIDYSIAVGLLDEKKKSYILTNKDELKKLWKELFNGIERLTVVETVNPQLLLETIESQI